MLKKLTINEAGKVRAGSDGDPTSDDKDCKSYCINRCEDQSSDVLVEEFWTIYYLPDQV